MYSKVFDQAKYSSIEKILEKMQTLEEGSSFTIYDLSKEDLYQTRRLLYDWLHHMELKGVFQTRVWDGDLVIKRRRFKARLIEVNAELFFQELLLLDSEEDVRAQLDKVDKEEERKLLFERWEQVMT